MKRLWNWIHYRYALMHISKTPPKAYSTWEETKAKTTLVPVGFLEECRIDMYTNVTDVCAVRVTHLPTGRVATAEGTSSLLAREQALSDCAGAVQKEADHEG